MESGIPSNLPLGKMSFAQFLEALDSDSRPGNTGLQSIDEGILNAFIHTKLAAAMQDAAKKSEKENTKERGSYLTELHQKPVNPSDEDLEKQDLKSEETGSKDPDSESLTVFKLDKMHEWFDKN